jgi:chaperonin GroES
MRLKPLGARLIVKEVEHEQTTESGIVLPDMAKEKPQGAEVVAVAIHESSRSASGTWWFASIRGRRSSSTARNSES